jgi:cyclopropane-fatty-acyl-phospholipid synthase
MPRPCVAGANVERESERLAALGYDERFQRMWRMYLSYCEGGFAERRIAVVQSVLAKPRWHGSVAAPAAEAPWPATVAAAG